LERVRRVVAGGKPDRAPLFDLLPNDAVLRHFNGGSAVEPGDYRAAIRALVAATDGSRPSYLSPNVAREEILPDGRLRKVERWTVWTSHSSPPSSEEYRAIKKKELARQYAETEKPHDFTQDEGYRWNLHLHSCFGEDYYFLMSAPSPGLMHISMEYGLEAFSYFLCDCEDVSIEQLEHNTEWGCRWAEGLPADDPFEMLFIGEDIAFRGGTFVRPQWLEREYGPRLARVINALHQRGKKVMFHSDGNLNLVMDMLVEAGIDALNPVEVNAGMHLADLHRRYPKLVFAGGIDASHLLPFGTPQQIKDAVVRAIEDTEGRILVGSSTEVFNAVPLENYLAMREAAMQYRY